MPAHLLLTQLICTLPRTDRPRLGLPRTNTVNPVRTPTHRISGPRLPAPPPRHKSHYVPDGSLTLSPPPRETVQIRGSMQLYNSDAAPRSRRPSHW
ncbi:hypothetical protein K466DRAFT_592507 [Polyporus arcularius HHB13444]|uniref:Uncharacterized protein n=1 Tax=Polyporus arcularius HHB13444 TaxID=1314778 RepID=A0A5C3NPG7_9APHY|nr:hypothetical protein K466DRAFT_592507 [Polyporus arcularius HHB13444]